MLFSEHDWWCTIESDWSEHQDQSLARRIWKVDRILKTEFVQVPVAYGFHMFKIAILRCKVQTFDQVITELQAWNVKSESLQRLWTYPDDLE